MTENEHKMKEEVLPVCREDVGAVFLLRDDGAALLQQRDEKPDLRHAGMWVPPGGHAEPGETIEVCARREFLEETGYNCPNLQWLTEFEDNVEGWPSYQLTVFWACYDGVQLVRCLEGQSIQFVERQLARSYPIPPYLIKIWDLAIAVSKDHPLGVAHSSGAPPDDGG